MAMWKLESLREKELPSCNVQGKHVPVRPDNFKKNYCNIFRRIKYAWEVVVGKAETFTWPENEN